MKKIEKAGDCNDKEIFTTYSNTKMMKKERKDVYEGRKSIEDNNNSNGRAGRMFRRRKRKIKEGR